MGHVWGEEPEKPLSDWTVVVRNSGRVTRDRRGERLSPTVGLEMGGLENQEARRS